MVEVSVQELIQKARRKRMNEKFGKGVKLGMMRHLFVVLDMSECMNNQVHSFMHSFSQSGIDSLVENFLTWTCKN